MPARAPGDVAHANVAQAKPTPPPGRSPPGGSVPSCAGSERTRQTSERAADQRTRAAYSMQISQRRAAEMRCAAGALLRCAIPAQRNSAVEGEPHTRRDPSEGCTATNTHIGPGRTGTAGAVCIRPGLRVGHERQLGHRGSGAWRGAVAAPGFRGTADEGGGGAFQQGPDRCCGHAVQDHLVEGGSHAVWGWPAGACQPAGWLVSLLGEADVRVEHREQGAREPVAARRGATVMTSPRCPGSRKRTRTRLEVPGRSPNGPARITVANPSLWASPARSLASPHWPGPPAVPGAREELTSSISSWATDTHPSGRPASHHGKGPRSRGQGQPAPRQPRAPRGRRKPGWPCASSTQAVLPPASCGGLGDGPLLGWDMSGNAVLCDIPPGRPGHCWFRRGLPAVPGPPSRRPRMGRPCGAVPVGTSWLRGSAARHARGGALLADAGMGPAAAGP
jgi:hypothetical protein